MQRLEFSGAVRPIYGSLGVKRLTFRHHAYYIQDRCTATPQSTLFIYLVMKYI